MIKFTKKDKLPDGAKMYSKVTTIPMVRMTEPFLCESIEGQHEGQAGDFLVEDDLGGFYVVSASSHAANYAEWYGGTEVEPLATLTMDPHGRKVCIWKGDHHLADVYHLTTLYDVLSAPALPQQHCTVATAEQYYRIGGAEQHVFFDELATKRERARMIQTREEALRHLNNSVADGEVRLISPI